MEERLLRIHRCTECYGLKYNKYTKPDAYCSVTAPDKKIDIDFKMYLPTWCPLEDKRTLIQQSYTRKDTIKEIRPYVESAISVLCDDNYSRTFAVISLRNLLAFLEGE